MKFDRKTIKDLARREIQYNTHDPFEATLRAVETWMGKTGVIMISKCEIETIRGLVEIVDSKVPDEESGEAK